MTFDEIPGDRKQSFRIEIEGQLAGYIELMRQLQERMKRYGLSSLVILHNYDPLSGVSGFAHSIVGDEYATLEAVRRAVKSIQEDDE